MCCLAKVRHRFLQNLPVLQRKGELSCRAVIRMSVFVSEWESGNHLLSVVIFLEESQPFKSQQILQGQGITLNAGSLKAALICVTPEGRSQQTWQDLCFGRHCRQPQPGFNEHGRCSHPPSLPPGGFLAGQHLSTLLWFRSR